MEEDQEITKEPTEESFEDESVATEEFGSDEQDGSVEGEYEASEEVSEEPEMTEEELEEPEEDTIFDDLGEGEGGEIAQIDFGVIETGRWLLKVISGPNNGAEFSMQTNTSYLIGTDPSNCDIVFHDTSVSRQHARISVKKDDSIAIEDLQSRNGTLVDGESIHGTQGLETNVVVTLGTTSFVVYDREGEMQTIISPLMPSIVKKLKEEEEEEEEEELEDIEQEPVEAEALPKKRKESALSGLIMGVIVCGVLGVAGFGIYNLFQEAPAKVQEKVDMQQLVKETMASFPSVSSYFNPRTGQLTLVGHLLSQSDKNRMLYNLQALDFIKNVYDTGVVIDQFVFREMNQVLERKKWKGVNMFAPQPGKFVLTGSLKTRAEAEGLSDYVTANFPYLDLLENRVVVEEDVISTIQATLQNHGIRDVSVKISNGELTIVGGIPKEKIPTFDQLLIEFKQMPSIRIVKNYVSALAPEEAMVNITDRYEVTGVSRHGDNLNVVINGRILFKGDHIDGMTITEIGPKMVMLQKDGVIYRIDF